MPDDGRVPGQQVAAADAPVHGERPLAVGAPALGEPSLGGFAVARDRGLGTLEEEGGMRRRERTRLVRVRGVDEGVVAEGGAQRVGGSVGERGVDAAGDDRRVPRGEAAVRAPAHRRSDRAVDDRRGTGPGDDAALLDAVQEGGEARRRLPGHRMRPERCIFKAFCV